jgi:transposase
LRLSKKEPSVDQIIRIGMDTSKQIFQLHGVNAAEEPVLRRKLRRLQMIAFFAAQPRTVIGIEAGGAAHHWSRTLSAMGHEVRIMAPQFVKPYVKRGKNDAADAEALCEAMSRPSMRFVPMKTAEQQAALMLLSLRDRLIRSRTQLTNAIRGHAAEFGLIAARGVDKIEPLLTRIADDEGLPALARSLFAQLGAEFAQTETRLKQVNAELMAWHRQNELSQRLTQIPGVGPIGATMLALKAPDPSSFRSARHFAAWIGLTPKDHSTGGKTRLGTITRAGDEALRSVLVVGATALIRHVRRRRGRPWPWLQRLLERKPPKLVAVALANKIARIAWRLMTSGQGYDAAQTVRAA